MPGARFFLLFWATLLLACLPRASAEDAPGITVGAPKAFDNRTLNLMLERLSTQLAGSNFFDQKSLSQAIGTENPVTSSPRRRNYCSGTAMRRAV